MFFLRLDRRARREYNCIMKIEIDMDKCLKCAICQKVCSWGVIAFGCDGPRVAHPSKCSSCHHCYAACPAGAISMDGLSPSAANPGELPTPHSVLNLLKRRYSCREYSKEELSPEIFSVLEEALRCAPTGCNARETFYMIFRRKADTDSLRDRIAEKFMSAGDLAPGSFVSSFRNAAIKGRDPVLRMAPHLVLACFKRSAPTGMADCTIGLAHFEIAAQSLGLGTCWCGLVPMLRDSVWPEIEKDLAIPDGFTIGQTMLFGKKAFDYSRPTIPNPLGQPAS